MSVCICLTGGLSKSKSALTKLIKGKTSFSVSSSINKSTNYIVSSTKTFEKKTSVIKTAIAKRIPIVNEDWIEASIEEGSPAEVEKFLVDSSKKNLDGLIVCLSGDLSQKRSKLANIYVNHGCIVKSTVTRDVMALISEEPNMCWVDAKITKSLDNGVPIMMEEFMNVSIEDGKFLEHLEDKSLRNPQFYKESEESEVKVEEDEEPEEESNDNDDSDKDEEETTQLCGQDKIIGDFIMQRLDADLPIKGNSSECDWEKAKEIFNLKQKEYAELEDDNEKIMFLKRILSMKESSKEERPMIIAAAATLSNGLEVYASNMLLEHRTGDLLRYMVYNIVLRLSTDNNEWWKQVVETAGLEQLSGVLRDAYALREFVLEDMNEEYENPIERLVLNNTLPKDIRIALLVVLIGDTFCLDEFIVADTRWFQERLNKFANADIPVLKILVDTCYDPDYQFTQLLIKYLASVNALQYDGPIPTEKMNAVEYLYMMSGRDIRHVFGEMFDEDWQDCEMEDLVWPNIFPLIVQQDMCRLLYVLTENPTQISLHFSEDIVDETIGKWIGFHDVDQPSWKRSLQPAIFCNLQNRRYKDFLSVVGATYDDDMSLKQLIDAAVASQRGFQGEFPTAKDVVEN
eukprot:TRINITY_DN1169_c0_g2_i2.p1 TRINITY_DN1169_c0_g2~~TRINITY_DN1169_c0_g2_i2.p1  ORF type:complete len:642 (+),score=168.53 TRINITY_DN1169_c0_g2_i2:44-1927(+)